MLNSNTCVYNKFVQRVWFSRIRSVLSENIFFPKLARILLVFICASFIDILIFSSSICFTSPCNKRLCSFACFFNSSMVSLSSFLINNCDIFYPFPLFKINIQSHVSLLFKRWYQNDSILNTNETIKIIL